jgi:hypothetical protein
VSSLVAVVPVAVDSSEVLIDVGSELLIEVGSLVVKRVDVDDERGVPLPDDCTDEGRLTLDVATVDERWLLALPLEEPAALELVELAYGSAAVVSDQPAPGLVQAYSL